jgi:hypothetical protein
VYLVSVLEAVPIPMMSDRRRQGERLPARWWPVHVTDTLVVPRTAMIGPTVDAGQRGPTARTDRWTQC